MSFAPTAGRFHRWFATDKLFPDQKSAFTSYSVDECFHLRHCGLDRAEAEAARNWEEQVGALVKAKMAAD
jgi:hypothetical protein